MQSTLHKAGIEVILDIVLNHSAELDLDGGYSRCVGSTTVALTG